MSQVIADAERDLKVREATLEDMRRHYDNIKEYNKKPSLGWHLLQLLGTALIGGLMAFYAYNSLTVGDSGHMLWYYFIALYYVGMIVKYRDDHRKSWQVYRNIRNNAYDLHDLINERTAEYNHLVVALDQLRKEHAGGR